MKAPIKLAAAIAVATIGVAMAGCTVTQSASVAVSRYCSKPEATRIAYRAALADALAPNRVEIRCVSDQP